MSALLHPFHFPSPRAMADALARALPQFGDVQWHPEIGSTNALLLERLRGTSDFASTPWLLGTHHQVSGRGRAGRAWQHAERACLILSCAFVANIPARRLPALAPLVGLVSCEALNALVPEAQPALNLKWPNDVQYKGAKIAGILVETTRAPKGEGYGIVIGMGLNLRDGTALSAALGREVADWSDVTASCLTDPGTGPAYETDSNDPATESRESSDDSLAPYRDASQIAATLATHWARLIKHYSSEDFGAFALRYAAVDALAGQAVDVIDQGDILFSGVARGCDAEGRLRVETDEGMRHVHVGDVSVRRTS
ncbi:MAG: biotin--[acetyl-CoA-carboxylase] ligase [Burkholderiaceae bacterium]|nr:biotin--[acetyl-CoA-carboxylase] ligase [Burkholderiaceae bacterium]